MSDITLSIKIQEFFNEVQHEIQSRVEMARNEEGVSMVDEVAMADDDYYHYLKLLKTASVNAWELIHRYGRDNELAYQFNQENDDDEMCVIFNLTFPDNFDVNLAPLVLERLRESMSVHIIKDWFKYKRFDYPGIESEVTAADEALFASVSRRKTVSRTVREY